MKKPTLTFDGLPILEKQFGMGNVELVQMPDDRMEKLLGELDEHMMELSGVSRAKLRNVVNGFRCTRN